ncbi:MAG TPA: hypothetical protein VN898_12155, partial [Candidatus Binatia bacterium]|nr:hypothetical protein [Candidatus Binatia bacterium]
MSQVYLAVAIEIHREEISIEIRCRNARPVCEAAVTAPEQDPEILVLVVAHHEIGVAIPIEVGHDHGGGEPSDEHHGLGRKRPIAVPEQNGHFVEDRIVLVDGPRCDNILPAIFIEIADHHRSLPVHDGDRRPENERSITSTEQRPYPRRVRLQGDQVVVP